MSLTSSSSSSWEEVRHAPLKLARPNPRSSLIPLIPLPPPCRCVDAYLEQVRALVEGGIDLFLVETIFVSDATLLRRGLECRPRTG